MEALRAEPPKTLGGRTLCEIRDYLRGTILDVASGAVSASTLPTSNVLYYKTEDGNVLVVRPSGTEPKVKVYVLARGASAAEAEANAAAVADAAHELLGA